MIRVEAHRSDLRTERWRISRALDSADCGA